jgi:ring-1,2-phenylacetyl-CoA epoxidase subunit PaaE
MIASSELESEVILIFGNRYFQSIIFRDQLEDLKDRYLGRFRVFHVLSAEPNDVDLFSGRIDRAKLEGFAKGFIQMDTISEVFVCGPEPLIRLTKEFCLERGIAEDNIHFELFGTPNPTAGGNAEKPAETIVETGKRCAVTVVFDGQENNFFNNGPGLESSFAADSDISIVVPIELHFRFDSAFDFGLGLLWESFEQRTNPLSLFRECQFDGCDRRFLGAGRHRL